MPEPITAPNIAAVMPPIADLLAVIRAKALREVKPGLGDEETAKRVTAIAADVVQATLETEMAQTFRNEFHELLSEHLLEHGFRPDDREEAMEWEDKLDTAFENLLDTDVATLCGPGFMGEFTIDARLHLDNAVPLKAKRIAQRLAAEMRRDKGSDAKFLSAAGVVGKDLAPIGVETTKPGSKRETGESKQEKTLMTGNWQLFLDTVRGAIEMGYSPEDMRQELDSLGDSDDILAESAASRLLPGQEKELVAGVRAYKELVGGTWIDFAIRDLPPADTGGGAAAPEAKPAKAPKAAKAAKADAPLGPPGALPPPGPVGPASEPAVKKLTKKEQAAQAKAAAAAKGSDATVLVRLVRENAQCNEQELAEMIGVSRSAVNNALNGKKDLPPLSDEATNALYAFVNSKLEGLKQAASSIEAGMI